MSDTPITEQPAPEAEQTPETPAIDDTDAQEADEVDDWRTDFDAEKAAARIKKLQSESRNLRDRLKTAEKAATDVSEKDRTIGSLQAENLRLTVGYELGLPHKLAARLSGNTREELISDAEELLKLVSPASRKVVEDLRPGSQPEAIPEETDVDKIAARMFSN